MIDYAVLDAPIDQLIWQEIADSPCPEDFRTYLRHRPEGAAHFDEAIERLIELDDAGAECSNDDTRYPAAIVAILQRAQQGDPVAQFHMAKACDIGLGVSAHRDTAIGWYRAAILQREPRSHINLAILLEQQGTAESFAEARRLFQAAADMGESTGTYCLGRMSSRGRGEPDGQPDKTRAFELLHQAWDAGVVDAGYSIGYQLQSGDGVRRDDALASAWIEKAARAGCRDAILQLGMAAEFADPPDISAAADWYRMGAERNDMECQHRLATLLLRGDGILKDGAQAVHWLKRAAVRDNPDAQRILGLAYLWGIDVVRNERFGRKWLSRAAEQGDAHSAYHMGKLLQQGPAPELAAAKAWFERAARAGHTEAQCAVGICYWKGRGVTGDAHAAFKWIKLAALQGDPWGLYLLGRLHFDGIDVPADHAQGARYFRQAAERDHPSGQAKLGWCYLYGEGVERDIAEGMLWLSRAAEQGDAEASAIIGYVLRDGIGVTPSAAEASKWFLDAAEKGDARAQYELAMLYAEGRGLAQNPDEARRWMEKAAAQGEEDAKSWLLHAHGPRVCPAIETSTTPA